MRFGCLRGFLFRRGGSLLPALAHRGFVPIARVAVAGDWRGPGRGEGLVVCRLGRFESVPEIFDSFPGFFQLGQFLGSGCLLPEFPGGFTSGLAASIPDLDLVAEPRALLEGELFQVEGEGGFHLGLVDLFTQLDGKAEGLGFPILVLQVGDHLGPGDSVVVDRAKLDLQGLVRLQGKGLGVLLQLHPGLPVGLGGDGHGKARGEITELGGELEFRVEGAAQNVLVGIAIIFTRDQRTRGLLVLGLLDQGRGGQGLVGAEAQGELAAFGNGQAAGEGIPVLLREPGVGRGHDPEAQVLETRKVVDRNLGPGRLVVSGDDPVGEVGIDAGNCGDHRARFGVEGNPSFLDETLFVALLELGPARDLSGNGNLNLQVPSFPVLNRFHLVGQLGEGLVAQGTEEAFEEKPGVGTAEEKDQAHHEGSGKDSDKGRSRAGLLDHAVDVAPDLDAVDLPTDLIEQFPGAVGSVLQFDRGGQAFFQGGIVAIQPGGSGIDSARGRHPASNPGSHPEKGSEDREAEDQADPALANRDGPVDQHCDAGQQDRGTREGQADAGQPGQGPSAMSGRESLPNGIGEPGGRVGIHEKRTIGSWVGGEISRVRWCVATATPFRRPG